MKTIVNVICKKGEGVMRMTREQMKKKYPNMWIGITDIQYNKDNVIESANVLYTDKTASELAILALRGDSVQPLYTTPDNCFHIGAVM